MSNRDTTITKMQQKYMDDLLLSAMASWIGRWAVPKII